MQKNSSNIEPITKEYLDKTLDKRFEEYDKKMDKRFTAFQNYFDFRIEPIEQAQIENEKFKARVLDSLDWLIGAFKKFEEEHTILSGNYSGITDTLGNHEKRIDRLESQNA